MNDTKIFKIRLHYVESKKWGERAAKIRSSECSEAGHNSAECLQIKAQAWNYDPLNSSFNHGHD